MADEFEFLPDVRVNAWTGTETPVGQFDASQQFWGLRKQFDGDAGRLGLLKAAEPADERNWAHPSIGWGLVLPDTDGFDAKAKAAGEDAPEPLRRLVKARGGPILRWRQDLDEGYLRRYYDDGTAVDLSVGGTRRGVDRNCVPRYLLIYGDPTDIPWRTQFILNPAAFTGRLPKLSDEALGRYVDGLIDGWPGDKPSVNAPVVWTTDHGGGDITTLMRAVVGKALFDKFTGDADMVGRRWIDRADATAGKLIEALAAQRPALVATTSHGLTGPLDDVPLMGAQLGQLVDASFGSLDAASLLAGWDPGGAIWYSHACCSAGSEAPSRYASLFNPSDANAKLLTGVAAVGATVAPLPRALLSAPNPLKAWIGHVEPTFNWTLYDPRNRGNLASAISEALYDRLCQMDVPVGWALKKIYDEAGVFFAQWQDAVAQVNNGNMAFAPVAQYRQLVAMDRQSMVLLGDPTVGLTP